MKPLPDTSAVYDALREVDDPEAGMNIVELGLVYRVDVIDNHVEIDMTMTTPACPVAEVAAKDALLVEGNAPAAAGMEPCPDRTGECLL